MDIEFEWDENKNQRNVDKHRIDFDEAKLIWLRPTQMIVQDDLRAYTEDRYVATGLLPNSTVLVVVFALHDEIIRIISARKAKSHERKDHFETLHRPKR